MISQDSSLETLGLDGFSVQGNFDIQDIDEAIKIQQAKQQQHFGLCL